MSISWTWIIVKLVVVMCVITLWVFIAGVLYLTYKENTVAIATCAQLDGVYLASQSYGTYYAVACKLPDGTDVIVRANR